MEKGKNGKIEEKKKKTKLSGNKRKGRMEKW